VTRLTGDAARWIERLALVPHPEGGYFRETYRAPESVAQSGLPARYDGARAFATAVYFLLPSTEFSALHRLRSDELWFFHAGSPLTIVVLDERGELQELALGCDLDAGERLQALVRRGAWFGARVARPDSYALVGCVVAPGFEFTDFELADREALIREFPRHRGVIERLTR